jgi:diguanylate cyclase (GGDEF)-like protein
MTDVEALSSPDRTIQGRPVPGRALASPQARLKCYEVALDNVSIGICSFNAANRLLLRNDRYAYLYGLLPEQVRVGMHLSEVLALRASVGAMPDMTADEYVTLTQTEDSMRSPTGRVVELKNGRVVVVRFQPLPDGGFVSTHEDITERRNAENRVAHMAHHDTLTGLPNRALLRERLEQALGDSGRPCAVMTLDLDDFKTVNDALGYQLGDKVLRATAERLAQCLPQGAFLARLGADEFAVVLAGTIASEAAETVAKALLCEVARSHTIEGQPVTPGASIAIAIAPQHGTNVDDLLRHADLALSTAKAAGGGRVALFSPTMESAVQRRRAMQADLRTAIADDALTLVYQPVADLESGRVTGFEALLRWDRPAHGRVSPAEFIPLAEETGLIVPIGAWVLRRACMEAARWPRRLRVAVNVSAAQFRAPGLYEAVTSALAASGLAPSRLELEITESAMMQNWQETAGVLQRLKQIGVRVAMDDFGTGYSSLGSLRKFPFDKIKIDQSFVRELSATTESVAIVRAIVALCGALGMSTTAEGVETREQLAILAEEGCTEVQGYLLSTPRPPSDITDLLARLDNGGPAARPIRRPAFAAAPREAG